MLPRAVAVPGAIGPDQRNATTRRYMRHETASDQLPTEPMERAADDHQPELAFQRDVLGRPDKPLDVADTEPLRLVAPERHRLGLLVHRPHLVEVRCEGKGELPGSTGQIQQPALAGDRHPPAQVLEQDVGVRRTVPVVVGRRPPKEVLSELQFVHAQPSWPNDDMIWT